MNIKIPSEKCLEDMIIDEENIRMSKEYRDRCNEKKHIVNGWLDVTAEIQNEIVQKYGFVDSISRDIAVNMLRRARYIYPDNELFRKIPVYVRENKAGRGIYRDGDFVTDISLFDISNNKVNLSNILDKSKLNVIIASSNS